MAPYRHDPLRDLEAWNLWISGLTQKEIGERLGVTGQRVSQMLQRHQRMFTHCPQCRRPLPPPE